MRVLTLYLSLSLLLILTTGERLAGQSRDECNAIIIPNAQGMGDITYLKGPFHFRCTSGAELRADSGVANQATGEIELIGNVSFVDSARSMTASRATYTRPIRRLYATGDVIFVNRTEGMSIRGPALEYFASMPERPLSQVNATGRPHLTLRPRGQDADSEPMELDADMVNILGEDDLSAFGNVIITRTDLNATSNEARYEGAEENLELRENAVVRSKDSTLSGHVVQAQLEDDKLQEVRARTGARLESEEMTATAPDLHMFFANELIQRTIARMAEDDSTSRPVVLSGTFRLQADSIEAIAPDQVLDQVIAIGRARGESVDTSTTSLAAASARADSIAARADSMAIRAAQGDSLAVTAVLDSVSAARTDPEEIVAHDWLTGDTIIGYFVKRDSVSEQDSTNVDLRQLIAKGRAQSLYRISQQDANAPTTSNPATRPGINFASADRITLEFADGKIDDVQLTGVRRGIYLEPLAEPQPVESPPAGLAPIPASLPAGLPPE